MVAMAAIDVLLDQALRLPERERGELAERLLQSIEPEDGEPVGPGEWQEAWSSEVARRVREVRESSVALVDGDAVLAEVDAAARSS